MIASQRLENRDMEAENRNLAAAKQKIARRLAITGILLGLTVPVAIAATWQASNAFKATAAAEQKVKTADRRIAQLQQKEKTARADLDQKNRNLYQAKQALTTLKQQANVQAEQVKAAEQKVAKAQTDQRQAKNQVQQSRLKLVLIQRRLNESEAVLKAFDPLVKAELLRKDGRFQEPLEILDRILANNPNNGFARLSRGFIYSDQKRYGEAETEFKAVIKLDPQNSSAYYSLGTALKGQSRLDEAISAYKQAITVDPKAVFSLLHSGRCVERPEEAGRGHQCL